MPILPPADTRRAWLDARRDEARLAAGAAEVARRHGLCGPVVRFADGSLPVFALGDETVLKLYPPFYRGDSAVEESALRTLEGRLPVPTPAVRHAGDLDGWRYVVMSRLRGRSLAAAWPEVPGPDRDALLEDLGRAIAALHAVDHRLADILRPDWPAFLAEQAASCVERQRAHGLAEEWCRQIPEFLAANAPPPDAPPVLLHTEVMREHLLVERAGGRWRLSGLLDFEPAMAGAAEYEFASVGLFVTAGEPGALGRVLSAYRGRPAAPDAAESRRFLAFALLHRYGNLRWYLERLPPPPGATRLADLAQVWWRA